MKLAIIDDLLSVTPKPCPQILSKGMGVTCVCRLRVTCVCVHMCATFTQAGFHLAVYTTGEGNPRTGMSETQRRELWEGKDEAQRATGLAGFLLVR